MAVSRFVITFEAKQTGQKNPSTRSISINAESSSQAREMFKAKYPRTSNTTYKIVSCVKK